MDLIDWTCDTCHAKTDGRGAIHIPYAVIRGVDSDRKAAADAVATFANATVGDAVARPNLGLWMVECNQCAGACEGSYWIDLTQACTAADLDRWTEHLSRKTWITATNWTALVTAMVATSRKQAAV